MVHEAQWVDRLLPTVFVIATCDIIANWIFLSSSHDTFTLYPFSHQSHSKDTQSLLYLPATPCTTSTNTHPINMSAEYKGQDPLEIAKQAERDLNSHEAKQGHSTDRTTVQSGKGASDSSTSFDHLPLHSRALHTTTSVL